MNAKKVLAFMAVFIMIACPVAVACSCVDAADSNEKYNLAKSSGKSYDEVNYVFPISDGNVITDVGINVESLNNDNFTAEVKFTDVKVTSGIGEKQTDLKKTVTTIWECSYNFELTITSNKANVKLTFNDQSYYSGEGKDTLKKYIEQTFTKAGDKMVFKGKSDYKETSTANGEFAKRNDGNYVLKNVNGEIYTKKYTEYKTNFNGGKELYCSAEIKSDIAGKGTCDYDVNTVKTGTKYKLKDTSVDFKKLDIKIVVKDNGTEKKITIDTNKAKDELKKALNTEQTATVMTEAEYKTLKGVNALPKLEENLAKESASFIEGEIKEIGTLSTDKNEFEKESNAVKDAVGTSSSDNTWIWIVVAIIVIVVIAAIAVWYFKFRTPPAQ